MDDLLSNTMRTKSGCLVWNGTKNKGGYGTKTVGSRVDGTRKTGLTHRLAYELVNGQIGNNMCVLHRCDNPPCINPKHLFVGTRADNHQDMLNKGRRVDLKGEDRPNSKLSNHQVKEIKRQLMRGARQTELAEKYGVNQTLISAIKTGKVWAHINPE